MALLFFFAFTTKLYQLLHTSLSSNRYHALQHAISVSPYTSIA